MRLESSKMRSDQANSNRGRRWLKRPAANRHRARDGVRPKRLSAGADDGRDFQRQQTLTTVTSPAKQQKKTFGPVGFVHQCGRHELQRWVRAERNPDRPDLHQGHQVHPGQHPAVQPGLDQHRAAVPGRTPRAAPARSVRARPRSTVVCSPARSRPTTARPAVAARRSACTPTCSPASGAYAFSTTLTGVLNTGANTLTVAIPPTGTSITHFSTTINKKKSGKKTYYVMARCKKKKWVNSETH